MRVLRSVLLTSAILAAAAPAFSQSMTPITAAHVQIGGVPVAAGKVYFTPVDFSGTPITVSIGGAGGLEAYGAYPGKIVNGAIVGILNPDGTTGGTYQVPDACLGSPANFLYTAQIVNTSVTPNVTLPAMVRIPNVCGSAFSLDTFAPPANGQVVQIMQSSFGAVVPSSCSAPASFSQVVSGSLSSYNVCVNGHYVPLGGATVTKEAMVNAVNAQSGCSTPGNPWVPATNTCAVGGGITLPGSPTAVWAGGSGTSVLDMSGNGNNITIATSATASTSGITFSASGQAVQTPVTSTYKTAMVCYTHNVWPLYITNPATDILSIAETVPTLLGTTTQASSTWLAGMNGTQNTNNGGAANGFIQPSVVNPSGGYLATQYAAVNGGPHCTVHIRNSSSDLFYLDGILQSNAFAGASSTLSMVGNTVLGGTIVSGTPSSSAWFGGTFHLVVLWPTQLTSAQVTQAEQYAVQSLTSRNLAAPGAAPSMLSDGVSRLTLVGNSITACAGNAPSACWNNLLTLSNTSLNTNINRVALGGTAQAFMTSSAPYREDPLNAPNASTNVALLWDGLNDGCRYGDSPDQQWALDVAWAAHKRSLGFKILVGTMIDDGGAAGGPSGKCGGGLTPEAYQAAYNTLIYTQSARWFDGIADFSGDTTYGGAAHLGCSGCAMNGTYFLSDHVHPIGPSGAIIANIASAAINLLTTSAKTPVVAQSCGVSQFVSGITSSGILTCAAAAASSGPPTDMIENWKGQDGSGTTLANTGSDSTNSMTTTNVTWTTPTGFSVPTATYNGSTSTATAASSTNTNFTGATPFTICQWVNPSTSPGTSSNIMLANTSSTTGIAVEYEYAGSSGAPGFYNVLLLSTLANFISVRTNATIPVGSATLACFKYAATGFASGVTLYLNGTAAAATVSSDTLSGGSFASGLPMRIGGGGGPSFPGVIGGTPIFNRLLSDAEIAAIFTAGPN